MTRRARAQLSCVALAALLACGLAACGEKEEPIAGPGASERITLMLDYLPNADHAGIYAAIDDDEFETAGLDVRPRTPSDPAAPLKLLAAGRADLAISYEPELLLARAQGAELVSIGALVQVPLTAIISIGPKAIRTPAQLEDKRIGTAGVPHQDAYLKTILERAGVDPKRVKSTDVNFSLVSTLLTRKVDAVLGAFWNVEGVELKRRDKDPKILRVERLGVPTYNELIVVAREQDVRTRGSVLRRFMRALARGHASLRDDLDGAVDALVEANPGLKRDVQKAQVEATLPVFFPKRRERPFGFQDPAEWRAYTRWMIDNDLLPQTGGQPPERAFTNEFLPGEGL